MCFCSVFVMKIFRLDSDIPSSNLWPNIYKISSYLKLRNELISLKSSKSGFKIISLRILFYFFNGCCYLMLACNCTLTNSRRIIHRHSNFTKNLVVDIISFFSLFSAHIHCISHNFWVNFCFHFFFFKLLHHLTNFLNIHICIYLSHDSCSTLKCSHDFFLSSHILELHWHTFKIGIHCVKVINLCSLLSHHFCDCFGSLMLSFFS